MVSVSTAVTIKSDERILGDPDFVDSVLTQAEEHYMRQCALRRWGYDLQKVAERAAEIYGIKVGGIFGKGRQQRVGGRSLFCFWAVRDFGNSLASPAMRPEMSPAGIGYAVQRGEAIAQENGYELIP
jgi:putative transposase